MNGMPQQSLPLMRISRLHFAIFELLLEGPRKPIELRKALATQANLPSRSALHSILDTLSQRPYWYIRRNEPYVELTPRGRSAWRLTLRHYVTVFIDSMRHNAFKVDSSKVDHVGVFSLKHFKHGQTISRIPGELMSPDKTEYESDWSIYLDEGWFLVPDGPLQFVNHSCDPNCEVLAIEQSGQGGLSCGAELVAIKRISPGDELTFDYGCDATEALPAIECGCGSKRCRGWIVAADQVSALRDLLKTMERK